MEVEVGITSIKVERVAVERIEDIDTGHGQVRRLGYQGKSPQAGIEGVSIRAIFSRHDMNAWLWKAEFT